MDGAPSASPLFQRTKFDIDLEQLGVVLAESFARRLDAFVAADRIIILKACRARLAAEGGDILDHLLNGSAPCLHALSE
jgi:hypothetical protein